MSEDKTAHETELSRAMGARIRRRREAAGMTQAELAELLGYGASSSIVFIEQGRNGLKPDVLVLLCATLKMSPNQLFGWGAA